MLPKADPPDLAAFRGAQARISRHVAETPMARLCKGPARGDGILEVPRCPGIPRDLLLKLECLQASGSFKGRGALSKVLALPTEVARRGIVTASGGNHGLAVAFAGHTIGVDTTVYLPGRTSEAKAERIARWDAKVVRAGDVWDDAHEAAVAFAHEKERTYIHPFADPDVVAGAGTIALEALEQAPEIDLFVVAIGGGGLASGVSAAAKRVDPRIRIVGVEPVGAPTLHDSLRADAVIELASIQTVAGTLAPRKSDAYNAAILKETLESIVLVSDDEMRNAARYLLAEVGIGAELSGAAALAAILSGKVSLGDAKCPCVLVCGAGTDALG